MELRPKDRTVIAKRFETFRANCRIPMTQAQLGEVIGISRQTVSNIESAQVLPNYITWDKFCELEARHAEARAVDERLKMPGASPF